MTLGAGSGHVTVHPIGEVRLGVKAFYRAAATPIGAICSLRFI
jgi:hypothetical protein